MISLTFTHDMARKVVGNVDYMKNRIPQNVFDAYQILLADRIQLHRDALAIHREFESGKDHRFAVTTAADMLKEAGVLEEIEPKIPKAQIEFELRNYLLTIGTEISTSGIIEFTDSDQETIFASPIEVLDLKGDSDAVPHVQFLAQTPLRIREMFLEDAYAKCFSGTIVDRIHDPIGTLARYSGMILYQSPLRLPQFSLPQFLPSRLLCGERRKRS